MKKVKFSRKNFFALFQQMNVFNYTVGAASCGHFGTKKN
jgi:hypothetical protein